MVKETNRVEVVGGHLTFKGCEFADTIETERKNSIFKFLYPI